MSENGSDSDFSLDYYSWQHSFDFYRLRWRIREGPIWENIHVLDDACDPDSAQKPFQDENGNLHEIASKPLADKPDVAKLVVYYPWLENAPDEELPRLYFKLSEGQKFFTIGEYVMRVHPWLVENRDNILLGLLSFQKKRKSWPASAQLWVDTSQSTTQDIGIINSAAVDVDEAFAVAACEVQDRRYREKADRRQEARIPPGEEEPQASFAFHRLRWEVREGGSIRECVRVLTHVTELDSEEQEPFQAESGECHEIGDLPATVVPTKRLVLYLSDLEATKLYQSRWPTTDDGSYDMSAKPDNVASEWSPELTLVAGEGREFISIKDYVLGAYDWILSMRSRVMDVARARGQREGPEEVWLDPRQIYAVEFFNTKEHDLYDQWQFVTWSAQEMQGRDLNDNTPFPTCEITL